MSATLDRLVADAFGPDRRAELEQTLALGLEQTWEYLDRCGAEEGHLVIFDRTPGKTWEEKLFRRQETVRGRQITVWGM